MAHGAVLRCCGVFYRLFAPNYVFPSIISNFAASSSNTVFLWIHVLDLCVLLGIRFVRENRENVCFFTILQKVYGLFALHVNVGRFFVMFLGFLQYFIYLCRHKPHQTKKNT